jgi:hypothetical protein
MARLILVIGPKNYEGALQNLHRASNVEADSSNRPKFILTIHFAWVQRLIQHGLPKEPIPSNLLTESARGGHLGG